MREFIGWMPIAEWDEKKQEWVNHPWLPVLRDDEVTKDKSVLIASSRGKR